MIYTCRKKLAKLFKVPTLGLESDLSPSTPSDSSDEDKYDSLQFVNQCLEDLDKNTCHQMEVTNQERKLEIVTAKMEATINF